MTHASVTANASVNFGWHDWTSLIDFQDFWASFKPSPSMQDWGKAQAMQLINFGDHVAVVVADRIGNLTGINKDWATEVLIDGTRSSNPRPSGIMLGYLLRKEDVIAQGLPSEADIRAAFQRDAKAILEEGYAAQGPISSRQRSFTLSKQGMSGQWQRFIDELMASSNAIKGEPGESRRVSRDTASQGEKKNDTRQQSQRPRNQTASRRGIIAATVALGGMLTLLAWSIIRTRKSREEETRMR